MSEYLISLLFLTFVTICVTGDNLPKLLGQASEENIYSINDYGKKWMYFPDGDGIPRPISLEPSSAVPTLGRMEVFDDIEYRLYTRHNIDDYIILDQSGRPVKNNTYNIPIEEELSTLPIKVITHGWESSAEKSAVQNLKNAYLKTKNVVVIGVNWGDVANNYFYPLVAYETMNVGKNVGKFLNALNDRYKVSGQQLHLIGHSLGAHVMGNAAEETNLQVDRITGLDPARPLFEFMQFPGLSKLDATDANYVDVIHTCGGVLGVEDPIGHADFYPNNGAAPQPGCQSVQHLMEACSHSRSHYFFTESILFPEAFPSVECENWSKYRNKRCGQLNFMGENVNKNVRGKFYLITNAGIPFGRSLN